MLGRWQFLTPVVTNNRFPARAHLRWDISRCKYAEGRAMSEESDRMMTLLQELAVLKSRQAKNMDERRTARKRRNEISKEMKELAAQKKQADDH
jgi:hypothetical protein